MNKYNALYKRITVFAAMLIIVFSSHSYAAEQGLSFTQAIKIAQKNDPWLDGSRHKQKSIEALSFVANTQPDPSVSVTFVSLPTDGFNFDQENMTQFKVGVSQMFGRGDSLEIRSKQLQLQSQEQPFKRKDRENKVAVTVGSLWLDLYRVQESIRIIETSRNLFEQLSQLAESSYSSNLGGTRQVDIVRAQLELTQLEDRLNQLKLEQNRYQGMLEQWLSHYWTTGSLSEDLDTNNNTLIRLIGSELPQLDLYRKEALYDEKQLKPSQLALILARHPAVQAVDKNIEATRIGVNLAEQKYQPQWGVNASYGYRADDSFGNSRADLFSIGVVFDLPLFTGNRQDKEVSSAIANTEVIKTEKLLLIRQLISAFASAKGQFFRIKERQTLYIERLLPQIQQQVQASLTAYTNNEGDFSEVVRGRIAELNAQIEFLTINTQEQKIILEINYFLADNAMKSDMSAKL
ncbi:TolC family protein [Colwellia sp. 1_MG-2023]|uniref:TolC family protein n=1 Tax=unclassified Colwellia TaxID=196834 RepID=UPI001C0966CA|nr:MULTISPECIES: TolC family protein [unclassified Colwellia]MBU2925560.1 TolC family protein [Colwellia sp. C2M11]MDO6651471.1 TolC family protein [Colwellia sp. 3_MG-2023]MDO6666826.1 TolC family protein [Colwellia sp. 2_MG-2023]MDO6690954.1 TolC family protein [Colwellia sp. 1_MG-2023]